MLLDGLFIFLGLPLLLFFIYILKTRPKGRVRRSARLQIPGGPATTDINGGCRSE